MRGKKILWLTAITFWMSVLLVGCASSNSPADAVVRYLEAIVDKDVVAAANLSCLAWEEDAYAEASSFETVEVRLEGVSCQVAEEEVDYQRVSCEGQIVANYGGEDQDIPLATRDFYVVEESGDWRMCGYSAPQE